MSVFELKLIIYTCLTATGVLATVILLVPRSTGIMAAALFCLFGCAVLIGMSWQLIICKRSTSASSEQEGK